LKNDSDKNNKTIPAAVEDYPLNQALTLLKGMSILK